MLSLMKGIELSKLFSDFWILLPFLIYGFLDFMMTLSLFFILWQSWKWLGLILVSVNERVPHIASSTSAQGFIWIDSHQPYWALTSAFLSKMIALFVTSNSFYVLTDMELIVMEVMKEGGWDSHYNRIFCNFTSSSLCSSLESDDFMCAFLKTMMRNWWEETFWYFQW